jgi:tetratricopeptide (TPR) repeat protein
VRSRLFGIIKTGAPVLWLCTGAAPAKSSLCEPSPEVGQQIESASKGLASLNLNLEEVIEPLRDLRRRLPTDLFVHTHYQDAIKGRGVEGHLREMLDEYLALKNQHADDPFYLFLYGRALEGRSTPEAISAMQEVLKLDPNFASAHQALAEIYGSARFRDPKGKKNERAQFLAACPSGTIPSRPGPLPPPGDLSKAEKLVAQRNPSADVPELVYQAMQQDAWRLQRIRPFDWYTVEEKKQVARDGQLRQWSGWSLLVRHYRNTEQQDKATSLLEEMQGRLDRLQIERDPDLFWAAGTTLTALYLEGNQIQGARETVKRMESALVKRPDRKRSDELARLKAKLKRRS